MHTAHKPRHGETTQRAGEKVRYIIGHRLLTVEAREVLRTPHATHIFTVKSGKLATRYTAQFCAAGLDDPIFTMVQKTQIVVEIDPLEYYVLQQLLEQNSDLPNIKVIKPCGLVAYWQYKKSTPAPSLRCA